MTRGAGSSRRVFGFLGGSFDPVQRGHLALAEAARRERRLERVFLVPAALSPGKPAPAASGKDRLAMLRIALRGRRGLAAASWEVSRPGPSYSYRTLRALREKFPRRTWEVILGADAWRGFRTWRRWREIRRHHTFVVARRGRARPGPAGAVFLKARLPSVSSTEIRDRLARGRAAGSLPPGVQRYIDRRGLYRGDPGWEERALGALRSVLSPARVRHSRGVAAWARDLARRHGADPEKAFRAGLLHDAAKELPRSRVRALARSFGDRTAAGDLGHGSASAAWAARRGLARDRETLNAMARHTRAQGRLSLLDRVVYVADFSSPDRQYPAAERVRRSARRDLDAAFREALGAKLAEVLGRGRPLSLDSVRQWNRRCAGSRASR